MIENLWAALSWAEAGWPVFPLVDGGYLPRIESPHEKGEPRCQGECGKYGHGVYDATTDPITVEVWWRMWPDAGIGGGLDGRLVVDIDPRNGGAETWTRSVQAGRAWPETREHHTKRAGRHLVFECAPEHAAILNQRAVNKVPILGRGIDIKAGPGAYVVLPPSRGYSVFRDVDPIPLPDELVELAARQAPKKKDEGGFREPRYAEGQDGTPYGLGGMKEELDNLRSEWDTHGQFNGQLNKTAFAVGQLVAGGELEEVAARTALEDLVRELGAPSDQYKTLDSGWSSGLKSPRSAPVRPDNPGPSFKGHKLTEYRQSTLDEARRLSSIYGEDLRHVPGWGWTTWDGRRWTIDDKRPFQCVALMTDWMLQRAFELEDDEKKRWVTYIINKCRSGNGVNSIVDQASKLKELDAAPKEFDADPYQLLAGNGTINLKTGELAPFYRRDFLTRGTEIEYDPDVRCTEWLDFLAWAFEGDEEMVTYLQKMFGLCLVGNNDHQVAFFLYGLARSGKSTVVHVLESLLGDYATASDLAVFSEKGGSSGHTDGMASLAGARLATFSETAGTQTINEAQFKRVTGGDLIKASFKGKTSFTFTPVFTPVITGNYRPNIRFDGGVQRRLKVVSMNNQIEEDRVDQKKKHRMIAQEGPGILAWAVQGAMTVADIDHVPDPVVVKQAVQSYREENDHITDFVRECLVVKPDGWLPNARIWSCYELWLQRGGVDFAGRGKMSTLSREIVSWAVANGESVSSDRRHGGRGVVGLSLRGHSVTP